MSKIKKKRWLSAFLFGIAASLFLVSGLYGIPAQAKQTDKSVEVCLTRTQDMEVSLAQRAQTAKERGGGYARFPAL